MYFYFPKLKVLKLFLQSKSEYIGIISNKLHTLS